MEFVDFIDESTAVGPETQQWCVCPAAVDNDVWEMAIEDGRVALSHSGCALPPHPDVTDMLEIAYSEKTWPVRLVITATVPRGYETDYDVEMVIEPAEGGE